MKQMSKRDKFIFVAITALVSASAFFIRTLGFPFLTSDMELCLIPWSAEMPAGQGVSVLKNYTGDYNMTYITVLWLLNYLPGGTVVKIKLFSIIFDYACAVAAGFLVASARKEKSHDPKYRFDYRWFLAGFTVILLNPLAIFDSAFWGQCDPVYTAFILWAIFCSMKGKERMAHILMGIGFAFKLQTISALPFFLILYWVRKRFSLKKLLWIPIMMMVMDIPAYLAGYSIFTPFTIYLRQIRTNGGLYFYYPNVWAMFRECENYMFHSAAMLMTVAFLAALVVFLVQKKIEPSWEQWMGIFVWTTMTMMQFLPGMHDRYGYVLEAATLIYILINPKRFWIAFGVFYSGTVGYFNITFGKGWNEESTAAVGLLVYALYTGVLLRDLVRAQDSSTNGVTERNEGKQNIFDRFDTGLIATVNKMIPLLVVLAGVYVCVNARKAMIGFFAPDGFGNFPGEESNLHTGFYNAVVSIVEAVLPSKPLPFKLKLLSMAGDLLAGALLWGLLYMTSRERIEDKKKETAGKLSRAICLPFLLWSVLPINLLNGALWGHVDGICLSLMLVGACMFLSVGEEKAGKILIPAILWAAAAALEPRWLLVAVLYMAYQLIGKYRKVSETGSSTQKNTVAVIAYLVTFLLCNLTGLAVGMSPVTIASRMISVTGHPTLLLYVVGALLFAACFADVRFALPFLLLQIGLLMIWGSYFCGRSVWGLPLAWGECGTALVLTVVYARQLLWNSAPGEIGSK